MHSATMTRCRSKLPRAASRSSAPGVDHAQRLPPQSRCLSEAIETHAHTRCAHRSPHLYTQTLHPDIPSATDANAGFSQNATTDAFQVYLPGYRRAGTGAAAAAVAGAAGGGASSYLGCFTLKMARMVRVTARSERLDASWTVSCWASGSLSNRRKSGIICDKEAGQALRVSIPHSTWDALRREHIDR